MIAATARRSFDVRDYNLAATLACGQAFRWERCGEAWNGVVGARRVRLCAGQGAITAEAAGPVPDWDWLRDYLQLDLDLDAVVRTFPDDEPMRAATTACRGLRLLRQDPWECLASFILSSSKQIVQIRQVITTLCERYGQALVVPGAGAPAYAFPSAARLAETSEAELRACKMGFRAPFLLATARRVAGGEFDLARVGNLPVENARAALITRGVAELSRLIVALGGQAETAMGLSGLGDLLLTCTGPSSRNFSLGHALGRGESLASILAARSSVTEGVATAPALIARARGLDMPICQAVAALVSSRASLADLMAGLLARPRRDE